MLGMELVEVVTLDVDRFQANTANSGIGGAWLKNDVGLAWNRGRGCLFTSLGGTLVRLRMS